MCTVSTFVEVVPRVPLHLARGFIQCLRGRLGLRQRNAELQQVSDQHVQGGSRSPSLLAVSLLLYQ